MSKYSGVWIEKGGQDGKEAIHCRADYQHEGIVKESCGVGGEVMIQYGKDLTEIGTVVGTGGIFANSRYSEEVLRAALFNPANPLSLKPKSPELFTDRNYLMYAVGLLGTIEPAAALRIAKKYLSKTSHTTLNT